MVSIIIPVYNTDEYLEKCILSCLNQTYSDIEIILINDASSDNSGKIIQLYEHKYPLKIRSITLKRNMKQGYARNRGIEIAKGDYLCFVDSDDYLDINTCKDLYDAALLNNADIVCTNGYNVAEDRIWKYDVHSCYDVPISSSLSHFTSQCYMIISRRLILENGLFYPEGSFHEDMGVVPIWYLTAQNVSFIQGNYWYINRHNLSTTNLLSKNLNGILDRFKSAESLLHYASKLKIYKDKKKQIDSFILQNIFLTTIKELIKYKSIYEENMDYIREKFAKWKSYDFDWSNISNEVCSYEVQIIKSCLEDINRISELDTQGLAKGRIENEWKEIKGNIDNLVVYLAKLGKMPIVYGLGLEAEKFSKIFSKYNEKVLFCDRDKNKIGSKYYSGSTIFSPEWVIKNCAEPCFLITSDRKYSDMVEFLSNMKMQIGIKKKFSYVDLPAYLRYNIALPEIIKEI